MIVSESPGFTHFVIRMKSDTVDVARKDCAYLQKLIDTFAKYTTVGIRRTPEWGSDIDEQKLEPFYYASTRFTVFDKGDPKILPRIGACYDDVATYRHPTGFGLAVDNTDSK